LVQEKIKINPFYSITILLLWHQLPARIVLWFVMKRVIKEYFFFRVLVRHARKIAQQYYLMYKEQIPASQLVQRLASVMQEYTQSG